MDRLLDMKNNPTFQALVSLKKTDALGAANALGEFMQQTVDEYGDIAPECAPVYYEYGSACLLAAEESSDVFGAAVVEKTKEEAKARMLEEQQDGADDEEEEEEGADEEESIKVENTETNAKDQDTLPVTTDTTAEQDKKEDADHVAKVEEEKPEESTNAEELDASSNILDALMEEYKKQNNGQDPTDEILLQWKEALQSANLSELGIGAEPSNETKDIKQQDTSKVSPAKQSDGTTKSDTKNTTNQEEGQSEKQQDKQTAVQETSANVEENEESSKSVPIDSKPVTEPAPALDGEDVVEFLEIAWQSLEAARVIAEKLVGTCGTQDLENELLDFISRCLLRLGDHGMETGSFEGCITDYLRCLKLRQHFCKPHARELADVHYSLGSGYMYGSTEVKDLNKAKEMRVESLKHYTEAARIFNAFRLSMVGVLALGGSHAPAAPEHTASKGKAKVVAVDVDKIQSEAVEASRAVVAKVQEDLKETPSGVVSLSEEELQRYNDLRETLKLMVEKIDDVVETLVNPEASDAVSKAKAKEVVAEAMAAQGGGGSAFGTPTLPQGEVATLTAKSSGAFGKPTLNQPVNNLAAVSSRQPVNLTQVRQSANPTQINSELSGKRKAEVVETAEPTQKKQKQNSDTSSKLVVDEERVKQAQQN